MNPEIVFVGIIGFVSIMVAIIGIYAFIKVVFDLTVKSRRRRRWIAAHEGNLIGSDEWFDWIRKEGVSEKYFW